MERKKKVLFIASNIPTPKRKSNGVIIQIGNYLSQYYDVDVMLPNERTPFPINMLKKYRDLHGIKPWKSGMLEIVPFKYVRIPGLRFSFRLLPLYHNKLAKYIESNGKPDLVHAHFILPDGYFAYLLKQMYHIPYCVTVRGSDIKHIEKLRKNQRIFRMTMVVLDNANEIMVLNEGHKKVIEGLGFPSMIVPHGIDLKTVRHYEGKKDDAAVSVAIVSSFIPQKHVDWVIKAFKSYQGEKKIVLHIIGSGGESEVDEVNRMVGGDDRIVLHGQVAHERVMELLPQFDIFALPSDNETFGLVFLEASASGNAVIAKKGTGVWGNFVDRQEMLFPDSYASFEKDLHYLIDDETKRKSMALQCRKKVIDEFSWNKIINRYRDLYEQLFHL